MRVPFIPYVQGRNEYHDLDSAKYGLAWHNTSNDASDTAEAAYATRRTDGVSSHFYADGDSVTQSIDTADKVGHAGSPQGNENAICFEIRGANGWTRAQWLAGVDWDEVAKVAAYVIRAHWPDGSFQNRRATVAEMQANPKIKAHYGHDDMRRAWGGTTHTDPGPGFPWDHLIAKIGAALGQPQGGNDMYCKYGDKGSLNTETLQRRLVRLGYEIAVDRSYGDQTAAALKAALGTGDGRNYGPLEVEALDYVSLTRLGKPGPPGEPGKPGAPGAAGAPGKTPTKVKIAEVVADVIEAV